MGVILKVRLGDFPKVLATHQWQIWQYSPGVPIPKSSALYTKHTEPHSQCTKALVGVKSGGWLYTTFVPPPIILELARSLELPQNFLKLHPAALAFQHLGSEFSAGELLDLQLRRKLFIKEAWPQQEAVSVLKACVLPFCLNS